MTITEAEALKLERLKAERSQLRRVFTNAAKRFGDVFESADIQTKDISSDFDKVIEKAERLFKVDEEINAIMFEYTDEEFDIIESYRDKLTEIKSKYSKLLQGDFKLQEDDVRSTSSKVVVDSLKLPKLILKEFELVPRTWVAFWGQYGRIHEDVDLREEDKFQYLISSLKPKTKARDIVESYPPSKANYEKVIEHLKSRFGRSDLLIEVYIRDLLALVNSRSDVRLSELYDKLGSYLRALETLGVTTQNYAAMLYPVVESCLPTDILKAWDRYRLNNKTNDEDPNGITKEKMLNNMMVFLGHEVEGEEHRSLAESGFSKVKKQTYNVHDSMPTAAGLLTTNNASKWDNKSCSFCSKQHDTMNCFNAQKMNLIEKQKILKEKGCCFKCLTTGHRRNKCKIFVKCLLCSKAHATLMCPDIYSNKKSDSGKNGAGAHEDSSVNENSVNLSSLSHSPKVLLQTLVVKLKGPHSVANVRALIDTGSQKSYIQKSTAVKMGFEPIRQVVLSHSLFGGKKTQQEKHNCYKIELGSLHGDFLCNFEVLDQPLICDSISSVKEGPWMEELKSLKIAVYDVDRNPGPIEILIGADVAGRLLTGCRKILECNLVAIETLLGWCVMGKLPDNDVEESSALLVTSLLLKEANISDMWDLDVIGISDPATKKSKEEEEILTKQNFLETVTLNEEGRYEVSLPWSEDSLPLPSNKDLALKRLESMTRKLDSEGRFSVYDEALQDWLALGIIEEVPLDQRVEVEHYLPHRPVFKANSTTKVRPVFDASARGKLTPSLNQCLESGPNLMNLMPDLLLKFRELKYGVIADIEKAFLMISINPLERDVLRFLWWNEHRELKIFRHTRVVFGVKCSPFLLAAVIEFHLLGVLEENSHDKQMLMKLLKSFYVDNVLASFSTKSELQKFMKMSQEVMKLGKFNLRGWEYTADGTSPCTSSVMGYIWNKADDALSINLDWLESLEFEKITKRTILSFAHKVFDPIGLAAPVFLLPKLLLQRLWKKGLSWDIEVDDYTKAEFLSWCKELVFLKEISIPRWFSYEVDREVTVHTFCDASIHAYSAVVFVRVQTPNDVHVHLLASKARVTPVKAVTIPRLELIAATVGARLCTSVLNGLDWKNVQLYFWSDSTTVLNWIHRDEIWLPFVNNRVKEIRKLTELKSWKHVPGYLNPADLPSRGCSAKQLLLSKWWEGPAWLKEPEGNWPLTNVMPDENAILKEKKKTNTKETSKCLVSKVNCLEQDGNSLRSDIDLDCYCKYFSSYGKMTRMVAWIQRFIYNCKKTNCVKLTGELTVQEIDAAEKSLIKLVQRESFTSKEDKRLATLDVYEDEQGILRLKTKIAFKRDTEDFICPVILPSDHVVVKRLILREHQKSCHAGTQMLLNLLREHYWILSARKAIRSVISKCVICLRHKQTNLDAPAAALPENRTKDASIFEIIGVDLTGPLYLKDGTKAWICLYTCAVYRGVHLELLSSLSTEVFLLSFRRFISRRGRPSVVYCDNGTNFVGASNALKNVDWNQIVTFSTARRIQWIFSPPAAPWWGGFWERLIGVVKSMLRKVLGRSHLTYEQLCTILCDTESIVNSRPLTYVSENSGELLPLSPSLFMQDVKQIGTPDFDVLDNDKLNKRLRHRQKLIADLRARFRSEYLGLLVQRPQHKKWKSQVSIGDIVLIGCDNVKRIEWPLGRVIEVIPGRDNVSRLVRLQTATSQLLRPIQRVFPLEVSSSWCKDLNLDVASALKMPDCKPSPSLELPVNAPVRSSSGRVIKVPQRLNL